MIRAAIFDVDGTLVDSVDAHAHAWQDAFKQFGREIEFADIRRQIGKGGDQLLPIFLDSSEMERIGKALESKRGEIFKSQYLAGIRGFPKTRELFQRIAEDGKQIALASSAKGDELDAYKRIARITDLVDDQTSKDDAKRSKPHPDIFEAAMGKLKGIDKHEVLVVGDTPYDAQAAVKAGLMPIGLLCGGWSEDDLRSAGCIATYYTPGDLLANYTSSPFIR